MESRGQFMTDVDQALWLWRFFFKQFIATDPTRLIQNVNPLLFNQNVDENIELFGDGKPVQAFSPLVCFVCL